MGANKTSDKLYPAANTPETIYALGVKGFKEYIKTIGLFTTKATGVIKSCKALIDLHEITAPESREALTRVP